MPTKRLETSLESFLKEATIAYANGAMDEEMIEEGLIAGAYSSGQFTITDTYRVSDDKRIYSGREEVTHMDAPLWSAVYHGAVLPEADPGPVLDLYAHVLRKPAAELPIRGPRELQIGDYKYTLGSTHGPLKVARFAVIEEITQHNKRVYRGDIAGGWISK